MTIEMTRTQTDENFDPTIKLHALTDHVSGARIYEATVPDRFATNKAAQEEIGRKALELAALGFKGDTDIEAAIQRTREEIDYSNPATQELMRVVSGVEHWLGTVPTALALAPIHYPFLRSVDGVPMSDDVLRWVTYLSDGIGIRSRAAQMQEIVVGEAERTPGESQRWLSLACGAAQPVVQAMRRVKEAGQPVPEATVVDLDRRMLRLAGRYALDAGVGESLRPVCKNIVDARGLKLDDHYDVVEAVGFLEYLPAQEGEFAYGDLAEKGQRADARIFLANAMERVKPGGLLLVGNMRDTHPQLGFTLNVVQWPYIQPRSIDQMLDIFQESFDGMGIGPEMIDVYCPKDGVYALYAIRKPAE